jgi:HTH-type transcriptional regulator / antitoxin MqsA
VINVKSNICSICGKGTLKKEVIEEKLTYKGEPITIPDYIVYKCDLCNEAIVDKGTLKTSGKLLKNFKCKVDGLLTGDEIREIRRKLGLTQEEMSEILGGGLKGFARYETGQICQSKAMDNLLRVLDRFPQLVHFIQKKSERFKRLHGACVITQNAKVVSLTDYKNYRQKRVCKKIDFTPGTGDATYG